jgi:nucleoid DNA-binding protein
MGTLDIRMTKPRRIFSPLHGMAFDLPESKSVKFTISKHFRGKLNA